MTELSELYKSYFHQEPARVQMLGGAASNRHYYRLYHSLSADSGAVIGVIGENAKENHAFLALGRHMTALGLPVPKILASSDDEMRYLQDDLGQVSLYDLVEQARRADSEPLRARVKELLHRVMRDLPRLQFLTVKGFDFEHDAFREPRFCETTIRWDLNYFKYCFLKPSGYPMDEMKLEADFDRLCGALLDCTSKGEPWGFLYRDFQSRNVMIRDDKPWYIDFQGGYEGPVYYDVASFLWQTRANYSPELRNELLTEYADSMQQFCTLPMRTFRHRLRVFVFFHQSRPVRAQGDVPDADLARIVFARESYTPQQRAFVRRLFAARPCGCPQPRHRPLRTGGRLFLPVRTPCRGGQDGAFPADADYGAAGGAHHFVQLQERHPRRPVG